MTTKSDIKKLCFYELREKFIELGFNEQGTKFLSSGWCDLFYGWVKGLPTTDK
jgi:hypothetical protein